MRTRSIALLLGYATAALTPACFGQAKASEYGFSTYALGSSAFGRYGPPGHLRD
jgi:hypothetical protein